MAFKPARIFRYVVFPALIAVSGSYSVPSMAAVRTVHYQKFITLSCSGTQCVGTFPRATRTKRFNITRISCRLNGSSGSVFDSADALVLSSGSFFETFLTHIHTSPDGTHELNDAVDIRLVRPQQIQIFLRVATGTANEAYCFAAGTQELVQ